MNYVNFFAEIYSEASLVIPNAVRNLWELTVLLKRPNGQSQARGSAVVLVCVAA